MKYMKTNMKIWKKTAAFTAVALATGLGACTDDLGMGNSQAMDPSEVVCFTTGSTVGESREPFTRHAGYLEETAEEWELTGKESPTRAAVETSLYDYFDNAGVRIFMYDGDWSTSNTHYFEVPTQNPALTSYIRPLASSPALPGTFNASGLLSPEDPILWSQSKTIHRLLESTNTFYEHFRAYAFAPLTGTEKNRYHGINNLSAAGYSTYDHGGIGVPPSITYTVPDEPADQVDLIAACTGELDGDLCSTVPMTFRHVLSAVEFRLGFEQTTKVKSLTISGVYKKGTGSFNDSNELTVVSDADGNGNGTPGEVDDLYTYSFTWKNGGEEYKEYVWDGDHFTSGNVLTDGDNTLMMMPQTLPEGAYVTLVYCVKDGGGGDYGSDKTITCDISGFQWKPGHRYVYTLKETTAYDIFFDLAAGNVDINNPSFGNIYRGYIYVNGVVQEVSGTSSPSNRYYIYQSTGETAGPYDKDHTGYTTATWNGGSPTTAPQIPEYPTVMSPDGTKTWSEYITNRSNVMDIIDNWSTVAATAGRTAASYRIRIDGSVTVVIDNIWTTANYNTNNASYGSINGEAGGGKRTILLKGDNRLGKICARTGGVHTGYMEPHSNKTNYFRVTSYYGDGSSKGSLTICPPNDYKPENSYNMFFSDANGLIIFDGGTVFVGTPRKNHGDAANAMGCIGGPSNGNGYVEINGGVLTAVAYGSGAAIGGGCGYNGRGGDGYVYISGGKVYAYQHGVYHNAAPYFLKSTAIGGGSTYRANANSGQVTITGGEVYAESVGGVAIGGGSSRGSVGGTAIVNISGNAKVTAKSVEGTIYNWEKSIAYNISNSSADEQYRVSTAIGGGSGGDENYRNAGNADANGGDANITFTGGHVVTGSVGGGRNGYTNTGIPRRLGTARVNIEGTSTDVQAQFIMADPGDGNPLNIPTFVMNDGYVHQDDNKEFCFVRNDGGVLWMDKGSCTINNGTISNFSARNGGAVYMEGGTFNMNGGTIQNCRAQYNSTSDIGGNGGAVYINDASGSATVNITDGTITNNYADRNGGAVYLEGGNVNISGGTMKVNSALGVQGISATEKGNGGGVYLMEGNLTMSGGVVSGNKATRNGGGLYVSSSSQNITVNITGGEITGNVAENYGAGLFVLPNAGLSATVNIGIDDATYSRLLPKITGNSASLRGGGIYAQSTSGDPANPNAVLNLYDGKIKDNYVSAYVYNQSISNEGGSVTLALDDDGKPVPDLDYITVTIDPAGGDFTDGNTSADPAYRYLVKASNSTLAIPTPKRKNFRFIGWLPSQGEADTKVAVYTDGMTFNYDKDLTLTAQWELAL